MIRLTYDSENLQGQLECSFCGKPYDLEGNVSVFRDAGGTLHINPDPRLKVYSHFHFDKNAYIEECPCWTDVSGVSRWEAVDIQTGEVVAHGRVIVEVVIGENGAKFIQPIKVIQDEPAP